VKEVEVAVAPPLRPFKQSRKELEALPIRLAAQNLSGKRKGALHAARISPDVKELGCRYVIIGHSERRQLFGRTDEDGQ